MHPFIGTQEDAPVVPLGGIQLRIRATGDHTGGQFALLDLEVAPGTSSGLHRHTRETETFLIREGVLTFVLDGETVRAGPGSVVSLPPRALHSFGNEGPAVVHATILLTPPGLESYFTDLHALLSSSAPDGEKRARLADLADRYGLDFGGR